LASDGGARDDLGSFGWQLAVDRAISHSMERIVSHLLLEKVKLIWEVTEQGRTQKQGVRKEC
jgi:hypothetical protein